VGKKRCDERERRGPGESGSVSAIRKADSRLEQNGQGKGKKEKGSQPGQRRGMNAGKKGKSWEQFTAKMAYDPPTRGGRDGKVFEPWLGFNWDMETRRELAKGSQRK